MTLGKAVVTNISTGLRPSLRAPAAKVAPVLHRVLQPSSSGIDHRRRRYQPVHRPGRKKLSFSSLKINRTKVSLRWEIEDEENKVTHSDFRSSDFVRVAILRWNRSNGTRKELFERIEKTVYRYTTKYLGRI